MNRKNKIYLKGIWLIWNVGKVREKFMEVILRI